MTLAGIEIDDPDPDYIRKWDYSEYEEGKRTKIKSLWVDSYIDDNGSIEYCAHLIKMSNRGSCSIDDKHIRDPKEIEIVKNMFKELKF